MLVVHEQIALDHAVVEFALFVRRPAEAALKFRVRGEQIQGPVRKAGEGAAETIAKGIKKLDGMGLDTIIVGRGGGSIEDLWAFNEEIVARAIYEAKTPIISGTGHEVDNTIADYVADLRAPTPSAAAELAIPDIMSTIRNVSSLRLQLDRSIRNILNEQRSRLQNLKLRIESKNPEKLLHDRQQYLSVLTDGLHNSMNNKLNSYKNRLEVSIARLDGLSPTAKLKGGFGYVEAGDKPLTSVKQVKSGDEVRITLSDGYLSTVVK